jgi:diaminohydroxyphosphoribosylaminopyrimidine deaminase / 5-amino-6-(5-phosphoribosylamino)uracil reductase
VVDTAADREFMRRALRLAERGRGRTSPNPLVGAVLVSEEGVIVGSGHHRQAGQAHAEIVALEEAGSSARGATLYCTLEPCCHQGRTGPCVLPIVGAGVARVVAAVEDPNPVVAGAGFRYLREHGLAVDVGVRREEAEWLNAPFFTSLRHARPHVTMKVALSREGATGVTGRRTPLSGRHAIAHAQRRRAEVDAIAVGSETMLVDDPLLTARDVYRGRPLVRVVFDSRLRTPPRARIFGTLDAGPVWVLTTEEGAATARTRAQALEAAGASLLRVGRRDVTMALNVLHQRGVQSLLVEGGAALQQSFWEAGVVDRITIYRSPRSLGEGIVTWPLADAVDRVRLAHVVRARVGADELFEGDVRDVHRPD